MAGELTKAVTIRLVVPAAKAKPSPAIGQALGALGVNMMAFCKEFNEKTAHYKDDIPLRVKFTARPNRSFVFETRLPRTSWFLLQAAGVPKGAAKPGHETAGSLHVKQLYEIACLKQAEPEQEHLPLKAIARTLVGQCRSMGLGVRVD